MCTYLVYLGDRAPALPSFLRGVPSSHLKSSLFRKPGRRFSFFPNFRGFFDFGGSHRNEEEEGSKKKKKKKTRTSSLTCSLICKGETSD